MGFTNSSPYSILKPIADGKLPDSMPDGFGIRGLEWMPTGAGRALYGCGVTLMIVFGWLAFATYSRPGLPWDDLPSVTFPSNAGPSTTRGEPSAGAGTTGLLPI